MTVLMIAIALVALLALGFSWMANDRVDEIKANRDEYQRVEKIDIDNKIAPINCWIEKLLGLIDRREEQIAKLEEILRALSKYLNVYFDSEIRPDPTQAPPKQPTISVMVCKRAKK